MVLWWIIVLVKLLGPELVKKFLTFYGTPLFVFRGVAPLVYNGVR
jgi:hypothetical protein